MAGIKYLIIDIKRRPPKGDCTVFLMIDRATSKYCFVNIDSKYVCSCRFGSVSEALADLKSRKEVISFKLVGGANFGGEPVDRLEEVVKLNNKQKQ